MSSLVGQLEGDIEIKSPAAKFHEFISRTPYLFTKVNPALVHSGEILEGDWGKPGFIIFWNYVLDGVLVTAKEMFETIDDENNSTTVKVIEGGLLNNYKYFHIVVQATPKGEGSLVRWSFTYEKLNEDIPEPQEKLELVLILSKETDAYLIKQQP